MIDVISVAVLQFEHTICNVGSLSSCGKLKSSSVSVADVDERYFTITSRGIIPRPNLSPNSAAFSKDFEKLLPSFVHRKNSTKVQKGNRILGGFLKPLKTPNDTSVEMQNHYIESRLEPKGPLFVKRYLGLLATKITLFSKQDASINYRT